MKDKVAAKDKRPFYSAIIIALAVAKMHGAEVVHSEIVSLCDLNGLLEYAKAEGEIEFAGLNGYVDQFGKVREV